MPTRLILLAVLVACAAAAEPSTDWPGWRGQKGDGFAAGTGFNTEWTTKPPKELWRAKLSVAGHSGVAAAGGLAYIIDHDGKTAVVRALALADGKEAWRFAFDDAEKENFGYDRATPAIDGGSVFCIGRLGQVFSLNARTGAKNWQADFAQLGGRKPGWGYTSSPVVDGQALLVLPGAKEGVLQLLDKKTGKAGAKLGGDDAQGYATPVVATLNGVKQYVVMSAKRISGIDAAKGTLLWQHPWITAHNVNAPAPIVLGNSVFITSGYGHGCALLDVAAGGVKVRWENKAMVSHFSSPLASEGCIYGTSDPGQLMCLDAASGAVKWTQKGFGKGAVVGLPGHLVVIDSDLGEAALVKLSPTAYEEVGRLRPFAKKAQYWSPPIIADRKLLIRGSDELVCFDLR
jgi:outer membrane protein assembly factor BamB